MLNQFFKKATVLVLALALVLSATAALADGGSDDLEQIIVDDLGEVGTLADGRLNGLDLGAPVAIYYTYTGQPVLDAQGDPLYYGDGTPVMRDAISGIELWGLVGGAFDKVISASLADLRAVIDAGQSAIVASSQGYNLGYSADGYFWVSAPPDGEGKVYTFAWQAPDDLR